MINSNIPLIERHFSEIQNLCDANGVQSLYVFGSLTGGSFDEKKSDLDFFVEMKNQNNPLVRGEYILSLWNGLEKTFNKPVDLLTTESVRNPILREEIEAKKVLVYEA
jgi:predicted nucleotidyltransferase